MKEIRSNFVKESLLDYETLANTLKENTSLAVRDLLDEAVRETYSKILTEEDENDYEVEEVDDTQSEETNDAETTDTDSDFNSDAETEDENEEPSDDVEFESEESNEEGEEETLPSTDDNSEENDEWAEFEQYKSDDNVYNFLGANDEEIVKVYKLLKDEDQVHVNVDKDSKKVELKDNETGAEYLLDLGSFGGSTSEQENDIDLSNAEADSEIEMENNMNESKLFELVLNEYDSHVGYTDNYQKKDVMTTPSNTETGKNVNDWDAGVPKGSSKPWANKGDNAPFDKKVNEEDTENMEETPVEEATNVGGFVQQNSTSKSHIPNSNGRKARNSSVAGVKTKGTAEPRYSTATNESKMVKKVNQILKENEELKKALTKFKTVLEEAAVTNVNLGQIIKLISENTTTRDEKQEIISRFGKEAKTVEQSKQLYETISRELKKNNTMSINEDKQFTANSSKMINETQIYQSQDLMESLDLMHRICKK